MTQKFERILVYGGRLFDDRVYFENNMHRLQERSFARDFCIIEGGAKGADRMAREWARRQGLPVLTFEANWDRYGNGAGPIRNQWMLTWGKPDLGVAFPGGSGTANMTALLERNGISVVKL